MLSPTEYIIYRKVNIRSFLPNKYPIPNMPAAIPKTTRALNQSDNKFQAMNAMTQIPIIIRKVAATGKAYFPISLQIIFFPLTYFLFLVFP